jgi:hypothetical protein
MKFGRISVASSQQQLYLNFHGTLIQKGVQLVSIQIELACSLVEQVITEIVGYRHGNFSAIIRLNAYLGGEGSACCGGIRP